MSSTPARALGAVAAAPAVAVLTALVAGSATAPPDSGLAWPDGDYTVILEGGRAASGSGGDVTSAEATGELTGTFDITVGEGAEPAFVAYLYTLSGSGISAGGITGSADLTITVDGEARASGGQVTIARANAQAQWSNVLIDGQALPFPPPPIDVPLDDALPLIAQSRTCGVVEGEWRGVVAGLAAVAAASPGFSEQAVAEARFLAISRAIAGADPGELVQSLRRSLDTLAETTAAVREGRLSALEAVDVLRSQVFEAELLISGLTLPGCPNLGEYGLGISGGLTALIDAIRDSIAASGEPLEASVIADLVEAAVRGGLVSADAEFADALAALVAEAAVGADGDASILFPLIMAAAALGDLALADQLAEEL
ncbi:hypothetical protein EV141_1065 [Microcella putealis]|uniref:Uncharacterized protein n=1 Tax=Microcella putealis TaxID=337005 RepID=A0A4Q7LSE5_9MICO|nr:hypothetical protein [Microcella putealis]RZS57353.1 hypothetical protein EV141_1065 [Microcella putealis]TQM19504.1 hypothetical protein BJ957_2326 [Microcella putealis]